MRDVDTKRFLVAKSALLQITLFCGKIFSVAIYAFLRGEKLKPKIVSVEKKGQISGVPKTCIPLLRINV